MHNNLFIISWKHQKEENLKYATLANLWQTSLRASVYYKYMLLKLLNHDLLNNSIPLNF